MPEGWYDINETPPSGVFYPQRAEPPKRKPAIPTWAFLIVAALLGGVIGWGVFAATHKDQTAPAPIIKADSGVCITALDAADEFQSALLDAGTAANESALKMNAAAEKLVYGLNAVDDLTASTDLQRVSNAHLKRAEALQKDYLAAATACRGEGTT